MAIVTTLRELRRDEILELLNPLVREWFSRFEDVTPPQRYAVLAIHEGRNVLVASPTGSGKTLSAFLSIINELVELGLKGGLKDQVYCVYVSPLRSLNNDIYKNLMVPLEAISEIAKQRGVKLPEIRVGVRTGDTTPAERSRMLRRPPHILITTPESLAIVICAPKFRERLKGIRWVIVDEIHELCSSKRGVHLTLTLERLQELVGREFARIGLSATIHPLEEVARFLVGYTDGKERECLVADTRFVKPLKLRVTCPVDDLIHTPAEKITGAMYRRLRDMVRRHQTTLIFTNTRSGTERVVYQLSKLNVVDGDELAAHHSSLSRELRLDVEDRLKKGQMRAVVTSTSLELGIDIGAIDLVVQIGSPKSISRCLQRVGRSGHALDRTSKGVLMGLERDDLVEDAVIVAEALKGRLDRVYIPRGPLDVLAQHLVGMAVERKWRVDEAYRLVKRSYCYRDLTIDQFRRVLRYLSGSYREFEGFKVYGKIWYDEEAGMFGRRGPLMRAIYATNVGTIPDEVAIRVYTTDHRWVGSIEEEFLERLSPGDIFILGGKAYQFRYAKGVKAYVKPAEGEKPTVPNWFSEMLPLSFDLGEAIGRFRHKVFSLLERGVPEDEILDMISQETHADANAARAILNYIRDEYRFLRALGVSAYPDNTNILVENYYDEEGRQNLIFSCVFGRRVHDALARAYAHLASELADSNVAVTVGDHGFMLTLPRGVVVEPERVVYGLKAAELRGRLIEAVKRTQMVRRRFRHCAARALMILRNYRGHEIRVARQQANAQLLMEVCEGLEGFPVLEETYREVVEDVMDVGLATLVLRDVEAGRRRFIICPGSDTPSPFTHDLILAGYSDVVLMADRRALLERLHESVMRRIEEGFKSGRDHSNPAR